MGSGCRLFRVVLVTNVGLVGGFDGTGERLLALETNFFLSLLAWRRHMQPRLPVHWAYVTVVAAGQVGFGVLCPGVR